MAAESGADPPQSGWFACWSIECDCSRPRAGSSSGPDVWYNCDKWSKIACVADSLEPEADKDLAVAVEAVVVVVLLLQSSAVAVLIFVCLTSRGPVCCSPSCPVAMLLLPSAAPAGAGGPCSPCDRLGLLVVGVESFDPPAQTSGSRCDSERLAVLVDEAESDADDDVGDDVADVRWCSGELDAEDEADDDDGDDDEPCPGEPFDLNRFI